MVSSLPKRLKSNGPLVDIFLMLRKNVCGPFMHQIEIVRHCQCQLQLDSSPPSCPSASHKDEGAQFYLNFNFTILAFFKYYFAHAVHCRCLLWALLLKFILIYIFGNPFDVNGAGMTNQGSQISLWWSRNLFAKAFVLLSVAFLLASFFTPMDGAKVRNSIFITLWWLSSWPLWRWW